MKLPTNAITGAVGCMSLLLRFVCVCLTASSVPAGLGRKPAKSLLAGDRTKPGVYPSRSPCPHTLGFYKYCAPAFDFICPDIYLQKCDWVCEQYVYENQPPFIPEQRSDSRGERRTWLANGTHGALGCSPFGVEQVSPEKSEFRKPYGLLPRMRKHILEAQEKGPWNTFGFYFDEPCARALGKKDVWTRTMGEFGLTVTRPMSFGTPSSGYGMIIHKGNGGFLLIGQGFQVTFTNAGSTATYTGILDFRELLVDDEGSITEGRRLNGDQRMGDNYGIMPSENIDLSKFTIWVFIPAKTQVAEGTAYSIIEPAENFYIGYTVCYNSLTR